MSPTTSRSSCWCSRPCASSPSGCAHAGVRVRYVRLGDPESVPSLNGEVLRALEAEPFDKVVITEPGEWRLVEAFEALAQMAPVPVEVRRTTASSAPGRVRRLGGGSRELRMEFFYREMRRQDRPADGRRSAGRRRDGTSTRRTASACPRASSRRRRVGVAPERGHPRDPGRDGRALPRQLRRSGRPSPMPPTADGGAAAAGATSSPPSCRCSATSRTSWRAGEPLLWHAPPVGRDQPRPARPAGGLRGRAEAEWRDGAGAAERGRRASSARSSAGGSTCAASTG